MRFLKKDHYGTRVYQNTEWYEYVVKPRDTRDDDTTWYFTDDVEDAYATAQIMDDSEGLIWRCNRYGEQYQQSEN